MYKILINKKTLIIITIVVFIVFAAIAFIQLSVDTKNKTPKVWASADTTFGKLPLDISFTADALDSDGKIVSYYWDFGDGTNSEKRNTSHKYTKPAVYKVTLIATDDSGEIGQDYIEIYILQDQAPIAKINADQTVKKSPLKVNLTATCIDYDGKIVSYDWDFGDGTTSSKQNTTHTYNETGLYNVKLTVTDNEGYSDSDTITIQVIENHRPNATIVYDCRQSMRAPLKVDFSCNASDIDGEIVSYEWEIERDLPYPLSLLSMFSPVETSTEKNFTHIFWANGRYYAKLTVTDDNGATYTTMELLVIRTNLMKQLYDLYQNIEQYIPEDLLPTPT